MEVVPLLESTGRIAARNIRSRLTTPEFDTSAMDGYAISSAATRDATPESPLIFHVKGAIAAGDEPKSWTTRSVDDGGIAGACIEIMTGARFPEPGPGEEELDACIKMEDTMYISSPSPYDRQGHVSLKPAKFIVVVRPVPRCANRRFAGEDICEGDTVIRAGQMICASHLMPLASVGVQSVAVQPMPIVRVFSTGKELLREQNEVANGANQPHGRDKLHTADPRESSIRDVNGVFLTAAFREVGAESQFLGQLADETKDIADAVSHILSSNPPPNVIVTSGGVSVGKFDHVRGALEQHVHGTRILFHGLAIRPGHPVLFAMLPNMAGRETAFFGFPGNPGAAAACFRFLAVPYVRHLLGQSPETANKASFVPQRTSTQCRKNQNNDCFQPGRVGTGEGGRIVVAEVGRSEGPAKLWPFVEANCWVHFRKGDHYEQGDLVECYPMTQHGFGVSS